MHQYSFLLASAFIALFPVINPIGTTFMVNGYIGNLNAQDRKKAIWRIMMYSMIMGFGSLTLGHLTLLVFDLAIPVVQFGGGILICKTGFEWLSSTDKNTDKVADKAIKPSTGDTAYSFVEKKLFYPITFPVTVGAGTMSVIFTLVANTTVKDDLLSTVVNYSLIMLVFIAICAMLYLLLLQSPRIMQMISKSSNMVINKLIAFFTFCVGLQIMFTGIGKIFHIQVL